MPVTIKAITPTVGLEIIGMTADQLVDPQTAAEAQRALDEHGVAVDHDTVFVEGALCFRGSLRLD